MLRRLLDALRAIAQGIAVLIIVALVLALSDREDLNPDLFTEDDDEPDRR